MSCPSHCLCSVFQRFQSEQERLAGESFEFILNPYPYDTIPFILFTQTAKMPLRAVATYRSYCVVTPYFRLEEVNEESCCATLSLLVPVNFEGDPVEDGEEVYSLLTTKQCITVDLCCFCSFQTLPPRLVNRPLPHIEPKC